MNSETKSMVVWLCLFFGMAYMSGILFVMIHEQTHATILRNYNVSSTTSLDFMTISGATVPNQTEWEQYCNDDCRLANNLTEVVGYHAAVIVAVIWIIIFMISLVIWRISHHVSFVASSSSNKIEIK